jgi:predicted secreted hydrolase
MQRRTFLALCAALITDVPLRARAKIDYPEVTPGRTFKFPRDHGAHPDYRNEWWYVTGWLDPEDGKSLGFQVTFFRSRPPIADSNPSAFTPKEIIFAHAALSDPAIGHLVHDARAARAGFGLAEAATGDAHVVLDDWRFDRGADGVFRTHAANSEFALDLSFAPTQPILLEGDQGYSQKGPIESEASYYYSLPQMSVSGQVRSFGKTRKVTGTAWLDREWSSTYLDPNAVGWDWTGLNLDDGGAVMAFRIRGKGAQPLWAGGSYRGADGKAIRLNQEDVSFATVRRWHSPHTGADYPVEQTLTIQLPSGARDFPLLPLFDDQELAGPVTAGPVYWEGAVTTKGGRGYLELTGYVQALNL